MITFVRRFVAMRAVGLPAVGLTVGLGAAAPAAAAESSPPASGSLEELQAIGLGQSRGMPVPVPPDAPRLRSPSTPQAHAMPGTIFVNFDGAQLSSGFDDAINNVTQISNLAGAFAPYGAGAKREAVMQALATDWAAYDVFITDARPASGDYTMNMTGPTNPFGGGVLGIAPLDCMDSQTHSNITFAFHSANDQFSAAIQATTVSQEVAHSYGLEHVDEPGDIMNPFNAGGDASFIDACIPIVTNGQGIACGQQHAQNCPGGTSQNAHLELLELFGAAVPDTAAPTVAITFPADGDVFEPGASFTIMVEATDDIEVDEVQLFNNGTPLQADGSAPFGWEVENIPQGEYTMYVIATDTAGNETTSESVSILVSAAPSGSGTGGGDGSSGGPEDDDSVGSGTGGDTDGVDSVGLDDDGAQTGCGCTQRPAQGSGLLALALFGLVRRRRAR